MLKGVLKDTAVYSLSSIIARGIGFFLLPLYTRFLTPADYGILDLLQAFMAFSMVLFSAELYSAIARFLPEMKTDYEKSLCASTTLFAVLVLFLLFSITGLSFSGNLSAMIAGDSSNAGLIRIAVPWIAFSALLEVCQTQLRYDFQARRYAIVSIVVVAISITSTIFFVLVFGMRVRGFILGQTGGCLVGAVLSIAFARQRYRFRISVRLLKQMLSFSLPLIPSSLSVLLWSYLDRFLIKKYLSLTEVGIYGIGMRFASIAALLLMGMNMALTPIIYANYRKEETREGLSNLFSLFVLTIALLLVGVTLFAKEALVIMTTEGFYGASSVIPLLMTGVVLSRLYNFAPGVFIAKKTYLVLLVNLVACAFSLALNLLLIPRIGLLGASITNVSTSLLLFMLYARFGQREYRIPYRAGDIAVASATIVLTYLVSRFAFENLTTIGWRSILPKAAVLLVFYAILGWRIAKSWKKWRTVVGKA